MSAADDTIARREANAEASPQESGARPERRAVRSADSRGPATGGVALDSWPHVDRRKTPDRRKQPTRWWDSLLGRKRRARGRRAGEISNIYVDVYYNSDLILVLVVFVLNLLDAIFTLAILDDGAREANPVMAAVLGVGPTAFLFEKTFAVGFCLLTLMAHKTFPLARLGIYLLFSLYGVLTLYHLLLQM